MIQQRDLQSRLRAAWRVVQQHPAHALPARNRRALYAALDTTPAGRTARARLAIRTARQVLPIWQRSWPDDDLPDGLLARAEALLAGTGDPRRAEHAAEAGMDALRRRCELPDAGFAWPAFFAGRAAVAAVWETLGRNPFRSVVPHDPDTPDEAVPLDGLDTAGAAALAVAGASWERTFDPARRLAFWEWWLRQAIPAAVTDSAGVRRSTGTTWPAEAVLGARR